jgi:hypothetical protein
MALLRNDSCWLKVCIVSRLGVLGAPLEISPPKFNPELLGPDAIKKVAGRIFDALLEVSSGDLQGQTGARSECPGRVPKSGGGMRGGRRYWAGRYLSGALFERLRRYRSEGLHDVLSALLVER